MLSSLHPSTLIHHRFPLTSQQKFVATVPWNSIPGNTFYLNLEQAYLTCSKISNIKNVGYLWLFWSLEAAHTVDLLQETVFKNITPVQILLGKGYWLSKPTDLKQKITIKIKLLINSEEVFVMFWLHQGCPCFCIVLTGKPLSFCGHAICSLNSCPPEMIFTLTENNNESLFLWIFSLLFVHNMNDRFLCTYFLHKQKLS